MTNQQTHTFIVPDELAHHRLDQALATLLPDFSRSQLQTWIESGDVLLNQKKVKSKVKVVAGDEIRATVSERKPLSHQAEPIPLNVVYEDESLLIINKPVGLVVHPGSGNASKTLLNALLHHAPSLNTLPRAGILHRIDKNTSGLLAVAKTEKAYTHLSRQLKLHEITREYHTIVMGEIISGGTIDQPVGRHPRDRKRMAVTGGGKPAITHYLVSEKYRHHTRLKVTLETGRTHQIRVHMSYIQHPVVGDSTYGGRLKLTKNMLPELVDFLRHFKRQALHAAALSFIHPETDELVTFKAELPDDMKTLISLLNQDKKGAA